MSRQRGWVSVSVQTYQSHRTSAQRILQQEYTVDETGATLNALSRTSDAPEEEPEQQASTTPTTSIFIRDWKLSGRRAYIRYERDDSCFWFNPVVNDEPRHNSNGVSGSDFPCSRGDILLKLGMRGARLIPWQLKEGDVFRLGQAYVLVSKVRLTSDTEMDVSAFQPPLREQTADADAARDSAGSAESDDDEPATPGSQRSSGVAASSEPPPAHECYICYEAGEPGNPLISPCMCQGSVKFVHLNCLQRWIQPEGSSAVNTHCSICKARYPEKAQAMMIRPPALLLESWSNHRALRLRHWVSFANHSTASLGRFTEHNDVVIPDHSVSGEHALIIHSGDQFWLHDRESSNGTFIRLSAPLKLAFGEVLQMKMGKSLLSLQAKRSRWSRLRMRLNILRLGSADRGEDDSSSRNSTNRNSGDRDCVTPVLAPRTSRDEVREVAPGEMEPHP